MNEALTPRDDIVPIESPAVWLGRDMAARNDWMYPLSRADISELEEPSRASARAGWRCSSYSARISSFRNLGPC